MPRLRRELDVAETVVLVNRYLREASTNVDGQKNLTEVAEKLGWTVQQLTKFRRDYAALINYDSSIAAAENYVDMPEPVLPPSQADLLAPPDGSDLYSEPPTDEQLASAVALADANLMRTGLEKIGLSPEAATEASAMQQFNRNYFMQSMEMVATNGMRTSLEFAAQQRVVKGRLDEVREQIKSYGGILSDDREAWVREERLLMRQFVEIGVIINHIQDTWFRGTAVLAVAKMRVRQGPNNQMTQRSNKPGFRPVQNVEEVA